MRRMIIPMLFVLWAGACTETVIPPIDLSGLGADTLDPGQDPASPDLPGADVLQDPGAEVGLPDAAENDAPDSGVPGDTPSDSLGSDPGEDSPGGDPGGDEDFPPTDPCGLILNPKCDPTNCVAPSGLPGTCRGGQDCRCVENSEPPPECQTDQDCVNRPWEPKCLGHWDCVRGRCEASCGSPCGNEVCEPDLGESPLSCATDCPLVTPCQENKDCAEGFWCAREVGQCDGGGTCQVRPTICPRIYRPVCGCDGKTYNNDCLAAIEGIAVRSTGPCPERECETPRDCLGRDWLVDCPGHWGCSSVGVCQPLCDVTHCGDGVCDGEKGEDLGSCPRDCQIDLCTLQMGPFCLPMDCQMADGSPGKCGGDDQGGCTCAPPFGRCTQDQDCIHQRWPIRCLGHWDCEKGACIPTCGEPCGDQVCQPDQGEDRNFCSPDCPDRDTHCDDGTIPLCEMVPPVCSEGEILAWQQSCFVCVNPATCRPWGEPGCEQDTDCPAPEWCSPCGTSSCPLCDNCIPACIPHGCPTEDEALCNLIRPDCGPEGVAVVQQGCWVCVDLGTCRPLPVR